MKKKLKVLSMFLSVVMLLSAALTGCGGDKNPATGSAVTSSSGDTTAQETKKEENEPKIKISMVMNNAGLAHPDGVDPKDNYWINIVKEYANVDLDLEVPAYPDYNTKLNLMLSSGNLPDIVQGLTTAPGDMYKFADEGAFIDLKGYYDKSEPIKKYITDEMMELAKAPSGKYYRIPAAWTAAPQGTAVFARYDLIEKYNGGKWPESVDEWVDFMGRLHKAEPNSVIMSNRVMGEEGLTYNALPIYYWYGALPYNSRYELDTGKAVSTFTLPEYKAATQVMRKLYEDGILDKEFATADTPKFIDTMNNKNNLLIVNSLDQYAPNVLANQYTNKNLPQAKEWKWIAAPELKNYPAELKDTYYTTPYKSLPIGGAGLYISSKCKTPDRAWKVIEGFAQDKLYDAIFWGREGQEYKLENGKKVPVPEKLTDANFKWSLHLALIFGFVNGQEVKNAIGEAILPKDYFDTVNKHFEPIDTAARNKGISPLNPTLVTYSDNALKKKAEAKAFITSATVEAIMGRITMEQFDQRVKEYQNNYGFIHDEETKYIQEHKDELIKYGVKFSK